ncbi:MAG: hypothetical protein R3D29_16615 [Nitratireductor sp.]
MTALIPEWPKFKSETMEPFRFESQIGDLYLKTYKAQSVNP